jgi:ATP-dependent DNA ligase
MRAMIHILTFAIRSPLAGRDRLHQSACPQTCKGPISYSRPVRISRRQLRDCSENWFSGCHLCPGIPQRCYPLPVSPHLSHPYLPMEAISVPSIPEGSTWQYEPKWDGFRCLAFKDRDQIELQSKSGKLLTRSFPEIVEALRRLPPANLVLDGELVIPVDGELSFDHLLTRLTQSAARAKKLAAEHPALMFVFDILADDGGLLVGETLAKRRAKLERFAAEHLDDNGTLRLSPATKDITVALKWLALAGGSLDGVVAKRLDLPGRSKSASS